MKKIGILHISDVHIDKASISDIDSLVKKLIEDINTVKKVKTKYTKAKFKKELPLHLLLLQVRNF